MKLSLIFIALSSLLAGPLWATPNATSALPDLVPAAVTNPYYRGIVAEVAPLHPKRLLLGTDPDVAFAGFQRNSVAGRAVFSDVTVSGMPFQRAIRIDTDRKPQEWQTHVQSFSDADIENGDVLYVTAWVRALRITDGRDAGHGRLYASTERGGNQHDSAPLGASDFAIPTLWTRIHIPLASGRDYAPGDQLKLMFTFGQTGQVVEIGGIAVLDFGPDVDRAALPHAALALGYPGRAPGATWRKAALARIAKYREARLTVRVVDEKGRPLPGVQVHARMERRSFLFGAATPVGMLPGQHVKPWNADFARTAGASDADKLNLQRTFLRLFNATTQSVTWAVWDGADPRISRDDILAGLRWFRANHIPVLNSQVVYPSPEFTDPQVARTLMDSAHAAAFKAAVDGFIREELSPPLGDYLSSAEIANELEGRPQYTEILGHDAVVEWFQQARRVNPAIGREINGPYDLGQQTVQTMGRGGHWPTSEGLQFYYDLIAYLRRRDAPIQYIGFQNHAGIGAPGPEAVLRSLDQFATLGLPLEVTEFEVTLQSGQDLAQRRYQADYVRDFLIAAFSQPSVRAIILQDFWQPGAWQPNGASCFFNADWSENPNGKAYEDLVLHRWWTDTGGTTNRQGIFATRGFLGDYQVTMVWGNKTATVATRLNRPGTALTVFLR